MIVNQVLAYYTSKINDFGPSSRGVDWNEGESHDLRHRQFLRLLVDPNSSVLDLGCGYGDFYRFLRSNGHQGPFIGLDIAADMIAAAKATHGEGDDRTWRVAEAEESMADYAIASGLLNVKGDVATKVWENYTIDIIDRLAKAGRRGFGFNVLSLSSDPERRRSDLFYADPAQFINLCISRYGKSVALLQDYGLYEFTLLVRHQHVG